jgi:RNA ligase
MKDLLNKYIEEGWVMKQSHPTLPLSIYNYTQATQYESKWDEVTLMCRGLVLDDAGNIIARPFGKFFNYEEVYNQVPTKGDYVYVQEKMDGSMGILFYYEGEWIMATRGSFTSDQAVKGMEIAKRLFNLDAFEKSITYLCEIIYPENRIVVNYDEEKLVFLGASTPKEELHWTTAKSFFKYSGISKKYMVKTEQHFAFGHELFKSLKAKNTENAEGFVLRFQPGNFRMKIKFEDYVALHRVLTNCSSYDIWESLMNFNEIPEALLDKVPDEFYSWVKKTEKRINEDFHRTFVYHIATVSSILRDGMLTDKEYAERVLELTGVNHGVLFDIAKGKDPSTKIWKMVKPAYEKPFAEKG